MQTFFFFQNDNQKES